jgi:hypothetical protein
MAQKKNPHARALGRLGGKASMQAKTDRERQEFARKGGRAGGRARAESLTKARKVDIARKAAETRWKNYRAKQAALGRKKTGA